jgi:hypothetical protein
LYNLFEKAVLPKSVKRKIAALEEKQLQSAMMREAKTKKLREERAVQWDKVAPVDKNEVVN